MISRSYTHIPAGALSHEHIGRQIRFRLIDNSTEVVTVTTAELRQMSHHQVETFVNYGIGAADESRLDPDQPVTLGPPDDYSDVVELSLFDD